MRFGTYGRLDSSTSYILVTTQNLKVFICRSVPNSDSASGSESERVSTVYLQIVQQDVYSPLRLFDAADDEFNLQSTFINQYFISSRCPITVPKETLQSNSLSVVPRQPKCLTPHTYIHIYKHPPFKSSPTSPSNPQPHNSSPIPPPHTPSPSPGYNSPTPHSPSPSFPTSPSTDPSLLFDHATPNPP